VSELRSVLEELRSETLAELPDALVEEDFSELHRAVELLEAERLRRLAEIDRRRLFERDGHLSAASWLATRVKVAWGTATEQVRMARGLDEMPVARDALARGDLSISGLRVLVAARQADHEAFGRSEEHLVEAARIHSVADLQRVAAYWRQAVERDHATQGEDELRDQRRLHASVSLLGTVRVDGDLDPETGETLLTALGAVVDAEARSRGEDDRTPAQRRADALGEICRQWLDRGDRPTVAGERPHLIVTVGAEALRGVVPPDASGQVAGSGAVSELDHVGPVSSGTARRIACDASVMRVVMAGRSEPVDIGRRTAVVPPAMRRAVIVRDRHCRFRDVTVLTTGATPTTWSTGPTAAPPPCRTSCCCAGGITGWCMTAVGSGSRCRTAGPCSSDRTAPCSRTGLPRDVAHDRGRRVRYRRAMNIVARREHGGAWWGRDADGAWYRWNAASSGWDGPLAPPWPPEPPPLTVDEQAIVAAAMAVGTPPGGPPINRVDAWWNRRFPPFSKKRLVFGLAALPVIGALQELTIWAIGWRPSLPRYLFVCIAGGVMLSVAFLPGMRDMAERLAKARGTTRSRWPWSRPSGPASPEQPPLPPIETDFGHDFVVALPFALVIMLVMSLTVAGPGDTFTPSALLTNAVAAVFAAALIALRTSVWGLVCFSLAGGLLGGLFLVLLSAMTFSDPSGDFLIGWGFGSVLLFLYAYPMWRGLRNLEARGFRLPMWLVMGGSVLLVSGAALVFVAEG